MRKFLKSLNAIINALGTCALIGLASGGLAMLDGATGYDVVRAIYDMAAFALMAGTLLMLMCLYFNRHAPQKVAG